MIDLTPHLDSLRDRAQHRRRIRSAQLVALASVAIVVAVPFVARLVDRGADSLQASERPAFLVIGWSVLALLSSIVAVHLARRALRLPSGGGFALAYDMLPISLCVAWLVGIAAWTNGHHLMGTTAAVLCGYHVSLTAPRVHEARRPRWTRSAPQLRLGVANVFIDNPTPERSALGLIHADLDVLVINESNPAFLAAFDRVGGGEVFPHRLTDPSDTGEYAVTVLSRLPFEEGSDFVTVGPMQAISARVTVDSIPVTLLAIHAYASLETDGYVRWEAQMDALRDRLAERPERVIVAGDFNTTHFRPEFMELLAAGARDAHDTLGRGWSRSIKLRATGLLASLGPVVRLDHALFTEGLWPTHVRNLPSRGSDHHPFVVSMAVRPPARSSTPSRGDRRSKDRRATIDPSDG